MMLGIADGDRRRADPGHTRPAHPWRAAGGGHHRGGHRPADALLRERQADRSAGRRAGRGARSRRSSASTSDRPAKGGLTNNPPFIIFCLVMLVGGVLVRGQHPPLGHRPPVPVGAGQRAGGGRRRRERAPHEDARLRHQRRPGRRGRHAVRLPVQQRRRRPASSSRLGLPVLAFAYLAGITSINGAIVGGMLVTGRRRHGRQRLLVQGPRDRGLHRRSSAASA